LNPLRFRGATFDGARPWIVGVLNVTPDSFSDGGRYVEPEAALAQAAKLEREGADWIDVGGESTRPGAPVVEAAEERRRVVPVIEALAGRTRLPLSIDTYKAEVADAALAAGAAIVHDIAGGRLDPGLLRVAARREAALVVGHLRGQPGTMQEHIHFDDVFLEVAEELGERVAAAQAAGVARLIIDPGIGFGKKLAHNLELVRRAGDFRRALGRFVMVGVSRKRFLGELATLPEASERLVPSAVGGALAAGYGASFLRVHDVAATRQALAVAAAFQAADREEAGL